MMAPQFMGLPHAHRAGENTGVENNTVAITDLYQITGPTGCEINKASGCLTRNIDGYKSAVWRESPVATKTYNTLIKTWS